MPRATHVLVEAFKNEQIEHGWRMIVDRVLAVGCTYRARIVSPEGVSYPCPTKFRSHISCRKWASKTVRLMMKDRK